MAGDDGLDRGVAGSAGAGRAAGAVAGELIQGDAQLEPDGLAGPLGQAAAGDEPGARFFEGVVPPLGQGAGVFGAAGRRQGVQHGADRGGAAGGQVAFEPGGAVEGGGQPQAAVVEPVAVAVGGGVPAVQFLGQPGQVGEAESAGGGGQQQCVGVVAVAVGEPAGPVGDLPGPRQGDLPGGQRRGDEGVGLQVPHPGGLGGGGAAGGLGLPGQPHPRRAVAVAGQPAAGHGERCQDPGVGGGMAGLGDRQRPQAVRLQARGPVRGVGVSEELQPRLQEGQRLDRIACFHRRRLRCLAGRCRRRGCQRTVAGLAAV